MKSYEEAKKYVRNLNLLSVGQWIKFAFSGNRPLDIPSHPSVFYKNKGWINWMDFLGSVNKQGGNRKYKVNDNYFKEYSHNMFYVLGFWMADGHMNKKKGMFSITQHKDDRYLLENILKDMKCNYPISKHHHNNFEFRLVSHEIIKDLEKFGGTDAKTHSLKFPKNIPKEYLPDFIRGLWDGDGCITFQKDCKAYVSSFVSASESFVKDLLDIIRNEISDFKSSVIKYRNVFVMHVGVNDTRRLRNFIYKDINENSLLLKRKYNKFLKSGEINIGLQDRIFLPYDKAQEFIQKTGIKKYAEWRKYKKENKIDNIPSTPENTYKNKGWINWETFTGTDFWNFDKAREYVHNLKLSGVKEWREYASNNKRVKNIPSNPWKVYKEWKGFGDWLGK